MAESTWSEADSETYRGLAAAVVPEREWLLATLLALVPFGPEEEFRALELGSGEGFLSRALLEAFPAARVLALDGSRSMRQETAARLAPKGSRGRVAPFELASVDWRRHLSGRGLVCSSLCVHHLDGKGKRRLFADVYRELEPGGALLLIDLLEPAAHLARELFADQWDECTERRSRELFGHRGAFEAFRRERWNHYRFPDSVDRPSSLPEQLDGLRDCGFEGVDCFALIAGHGVYGGYKAAGGGGRGASEKGGATVRLSFSAAFQAVAQALASAAR